MTYQDLKHRSKMEKIVGHFFWLLLGVVFLTKLTDGSKFQIQLNANATTPGVITLCEGAFTTISLICSDFVPDGTEPMWIRFDANKTEIWRSVANTHDSDYFGASAYNLVVPHKPMNMSLLLIHTSLLTAAHDGHKFICIEKDAEKDDVYRKLNTDLMHATFHILPSSCCQRETSPCGVTDTPSRLVVTTDKDELVTTNRISSSSQALSVQPYPVFDPSKCAELVSVEESSNVKNGASSQNMNPEFNMDTLKKYPIVSLSFVMICIMLFILLLMAIMMKQMRDELKVLKRASKDSEFTNHQELQHLHENGVA